MLLLHAPTVKWVANEEKQKWRGRVPHHHDHSLDTCQGTVQATNTVEFERGPYHEHGDRSSENDQGLTTRGEVVMTAMMPQNEDAIVELPRCDDVMSQTTTLFPKFLANSRNNETLCYVVATNRRF